MGNDHDDKEETPHKQTICALICVMICLLPSFVADGVGLYIGVNNSNATCYDNQNIISLSRWLVVSTSVCIVIISILMTGLTAIIFLKLINEINENAIITVLIVFASIFNSILLLTLTLFNFIMLIIGIVELAHQFPSCNSEVNSVTTMVIVIMVFNFMAFSGLYGLKK